MRTAVPGGVEVTVKFAFIVVGVTAVLFAIGTGVYIAISNRYIEPWVKREQQKPAPKRPQ